MASVVLALVQKVSIFKVSAIAFLFSSFFGNQMDIDVFSLPRQTNCQQYYSIFAFYLSFFFLIWT